MKTGLQEQPADYSAPGLDGFEPARRPSLGFGLLAATTIGTLALLTYLGAWASAGQIENSALASDIPVSHVAGKWWEDSLLLVCPLH